MESIRAEVQLEPADLVALMRHRSRQKRRLLAGMGWVLTVFGIGGLAMLAPGEATRQSLMICLGMGLWFHFMVWTEKGAFTKKAGASIALSTPAAWIVGEKGLHLETKDTKADLLWSRFSSCLELDSVLVLSGNPGDDLILPKRCLNGQEAIEQVRSWARNAGLRIE